MYSRVTAQVAQELKKIVGPGNIIFEDPEKMEPYSHDEIFEKGYSHMPEVVVKPASAKEISDILKLANEKLIPVTPRGAGSGLSGGAVAVCGGILLSVERMNKILEIDSENLMIVVEPGVITNDINRALQKYNLFFAGYPISLQNCFIGGNVAENAGGAKAVKYGVTDRYVLGLEVVLPTGEIITLGGKRLKDVTGYDLLHLMVGSEGTLGIFTKIILKVLPRPTDTASLLAPFEDIETSARIAARMIIETKIIPCTMELMDRKCMEIAARMLKGKIPCQKQAESYLLLEVDGDGQQVEREYNALADFCLKNGALDVFVAATPGERERLWSIRHAISDALKVYYPGNIAEDIVVPPALIPSLLQKAGELSANFGLESLCFGHLGDGNLHLHILPDSSLSEEKWLSSVEAYLQELYREVRSLGGTLSGEHGIGHKRKKYLPLFLGETEMALMKRIKKAFDPNNILNPGKIFDLI